MARHYFTKDFFRQMSNNLLARYFHERELFRDLHFTDMKEGKSEALFAAWLELPEDQRHAMDAEFAEISEMTCEKGWIAIRDEAQWQMREDPERRDAFITSMANMAGHPHRAMITFLKHPECWKGATRFYHVDNLAYRNWPQASRIIQRMTSGCAVPEPVTRGELRPCGIPGASEDSVLEIEGGFVGIQPVPFNLVKPGGVDREIVRVGGH